MSGWIKMGVSLRTHPKVVRLSSALKADKNRVLGGLFSVWCVFDAHSMTGSLEGYTLEAMDAEIGWRGFSSAMQSIGWLQASAMGLTAPRFEEHNGATAKRRALDASRKGKQRHAEPEDVPQKSGLEGGNLSAPDADKARNREEKNREEEKKNPPATLGPPADADGSPVLKAKELVAEGVDAKVAADWLRIRKAKKAPLTQTAWAAVKREAASAGLTPAAAVKLATESNWQGFKAAWLSRPGNGATSDRYAASTI